MGNAAMARQAMLDSQIRVNDVTDVRVHDAMSTVKRESFVPKANAAAAYSDIDVPLGNGRFLMKPRDFAKMLQALEIKPTDLALDIGANGGYASAVLANLAETVVALEEDPEFVAKAEKALAMADADAAAVICGPLRAGLPDQGPFDVIFVGGAVAEIPNAWLRQLADGGRLVVIERSGAAACAKLYTHIDGQTGSRVIFDAQTPYLPGFEPVQQFVL